MKLQFRTWLESLADEQDPLMGSSEPAFAVFKFVVPMTSQEDWDSERHALRGVGAALDHSREHGFGKKKDGEPDFKWGAAGYAPGSGGTPPIHDGRWELHQVFRRPKPPEDPEERQQWNWRYGNSENWESQGQERWTAQEEAKRVVVEEPRTFAAMVSVVAGRERLPDSWNPLRFVTGYIATSARKGKGGKKNVTVLTSKGWRGQVPDTGLTNAIEKMQRAFGFQHSQTVGLRTAKMRPDDFLKQLYGGQVKSWEWRLALTPEGWRVATRDGNEPDRAMAMEGGRRGNDPGDYINNWLRSQGLNKGMPERTHWVVCTVRYKKASPKTWNRDAVEAGWYPESLHIDGRSFMGNISSFDWMLHQRCLRQAEPGYVRPNYGSDHINDGQCQSTRQKIEQAEARLDQMLGEIPWMTPQLRAVANPFRMDQKEFDDMVTGAVLMAHDDQRMARPTFDPNPPKPAEEKPRRPFDPLPGDEPDDWEQDPGNIGPDDPVK